ncbi:DUF4238 domain-containing protein, partial [Gilliamella sp. Fer4-1]|uniref:DUF4238 domain-containing protein n=2 Tax=Gilliamella TaxID=1193503 RepID=UPI0011475EE4
IIDKGMLSLSLCVERADKNISIEKFFFSQIEAGYKVIGDIIDKGEHVKNILDENLVNLQLYIAFLFSRTKFFRAHLPEIYKDIGVVTDNPDKFFPYLLLIDTFLESSFFHQYYTKISLKNTRKPLITSDNPVIWRKDYIVLPISPWKYLKFAKDSCCSDAILYDDDKFLNYCQYNQADKYLIAATKEDFDFLII